MKNPYRFALVAFSTPIWYDNIKLDYSSVKYLDKGFLKG